MTIETIKEGVSLVHDIWDSYRQKIYRGYENDLDVKGTVFYILEETQRSMVPLLESKGFKLGHTTENRRTGSTIYFYVKGEASSPQLNLGEQDV